MFGEDRRIAQVLAAIARLRRRDATALSQGLSPMGARAALDLAARAITAEGLRRELATPGNPPRTVAIFCAAGVFTSPLEWMALFAAAGCRVFAKAPSAGPAFVNAFVEDLCAEGLPVVALNDRALPTRVQTIIAFGSDASMAEIRRTWPDAHHSLYGHRFSAAWLSWKAVARPERLRAAACGLARDLALYDSRGCMAPVAVFTDGPADTVTEALASAMAEVETVLPRGPLDGALLQNLRARAQLAAARGSARLGPTWSVLNLPAMMFLPAALPRLATVHGTTPEKAAEILAPWRPHLSTLGTDLAGCEGLLPADAPAFLRWFPRVCPMGAMQSPPFPRDHDGRPMLASAMV